MKSHDEVLAVLTEWQNAQGIKDTRGQVEVAAEAAPKEGSAARMVGRTR